VYKNIFEVNVLNQILKGFKYNKYYGDENFKINLETDFIKGTLAIIKFKTS